MNDDRQPWWVFSRFEFVLLTLLLLTSAWLLGPPAGWVWLVLPPSMLAGKWISCAAVPWLWRKART